MEVAGQSSCSRKLARVFMQVLFLGCNSAKLQQIFQTKRNRVEKLVHSVNFVLQRGWIAGLENGCIYSPGAGSCGGVARVGLLGEGLDSLCGKLFRYE